MPRAEKFGAFYAVAKFANLFTCTVIPRHLPLLILNNYTMTHSTLTIGQVVTYTNGGLSVYTGTIVKINSNTIIVVDDESSLNLWNAGYSVGSEITLNQLK